MKMCNNHTGFNISTSSSTRTRNKSQLSYKQLYISNLCIECNQLGNSIIKITLNGTDVTMVPITAPLCNNCLVSVQNYDNWNDRLKYCLLRLKKKIKENKKVLLNKSFLGDIRWNILNKIPIVRKKNKRKVNNNDKILELNENDYLLKKLK